MTKRKKKNNNNNNHHSEKEYFRRLEWEWFSERRTTNPFSQKVIHFEMTFTKLIG